MKIFLTIVFLCNSFVFADEFNYQLLSTKRSSLKLPTYSAETKKLIIGQARLIMDQFYVHREIKLKDFGTDTDPLPLLDKLLEKVDTISEEDFHETMINIMNLQHDLHAAYHLPRPYACHRNILPIAFGEIKNKRNNKIVISSIVSDSDILKVLPEPLNVKLGDELLSYNGIPVEEIFQNTRRFNPGANIDAQRRIFLSRLSLKIQTTVLAPKEDKVHLVFRNFWGKKYSRTIPWVNRRRNSCANSYESNFNNGNNSRTQFLKEFNQIFFKSKRKNIKEVDYNETKEPVITWRLFNNKYGRFGVIKISSFYPDKVTIPAAVEIVKNLLQNELVETDALVLDLRDNEGGLIPFGESLVQFFTPNEITPLIFKLRASSTNRIMLDRPYSGYEREVEQIDDAISSKQFLTFGLPLTLSSTINKYGQVYFKPVGILNNANCYSTCDMISAQFQDHQVGLVFGEDQTTGAGGANNVWHRELRPILGSGLKTLPFEQDMGISWRQTVRVGINEGKLIENVGVKSDVVLPVTFKDLTEDGRDQFRKITRILVKQSMTSSLPHNVNDSF